MDVERGMSMEQEECSSPEFTFTEVLVLCRQGTGWDVRGTIGLLMIPKIEKLRAKNNSGEEFEGHWQQSRLLEQLSLAVFSFPLSCLSRSRLGLD
jgi:hypothetical protein